MASGIQRPHHQTPRDRVGSQDVEMTAPLAPDSDAAMVLGMAATAMPFARSVDAEAERWLRILRLYGDSGTALQGLGVSEAPLEAIGNDDEGGRPDAARLDRRGARIADDRHERRVRRCHAGLRCGLRPCVVGTRYGLRRGARAARRDKA